MTSVALLVGRLPGVVGNIAKQLEGMPVRRLDDTIRGELIGEIASRRPYPSIHLKDHASGPAGMRVADAMVLAGSEAS